ncbi:hypothetical protein T01_2076 [Trichinella spiralis]|uniref:Uncharacterized protein n=1 Tax=Trichinella spiralis TaxID=6334 RepID=A0A0V1B8P9_TRISP|nr:hypothetical protein T01_12281 [Trichinella spiralis]KRY33369.1 hypothetical protein T01_2076 [Trichinella spiralis]
MISAINCASMKEQADMEIIRRNKCNIASKLLSYLFTLANTHFRSAIKDDVSDKEKAGTNFP